LINDVLYSENYLEATQSRRPEIVTKRKKPAWARTEEENQKDEEEQIDDLVDFIDNFDPKSYIEDVEVKTLIENIMTRVSQVKSTVSSKRLQKSPLVRVSTTAHKRPQSGYVSHQTVANTGVNPFGKQPTRPIKRPLTAAATQHNQQVDSNS
jgi:hypothetical protein